MYSKAPTSGVRALEEWCKRGLQHYPGVSVTNMTDSWRDGRAFCALIHRYRPDLLSFSALDPTDWAGNCDLAFRLAEQELGIPALLEVEDVIRSPDRLSLLTYLAQFYHTLSGGDSGISSLSQSPTSSDSEAESAVARRSSSVGNRRGAVLSLMEVETYGQRRTRSASAKSRPRLRPASPPIQQENPFIGEVGKDVVLPTAGPRLRQVLRRHRGPELRQSRRLVQSMYAETSSPVPSVPTTTRERPRSVLLASSYARPYRTTTTVTSSSSILSKDYRSRSQPPAKRIPLLPRRTDMENVMTSSCMETGSLTREDQGLGRDSVTCHPSQDRLGSNIDVCHAEEGWLGCETKPWGAGEGGPVHLTQSWYGGKISQEASHGKMLVNGETQNGGTQNSGTQRSKISGTALKGKISVGTKDTEVLGKTERIAVSGKTEGRKISKLFGKKAKKSFGNITSSGSVETGIFNSDENIIEKSKKNIDKFQLWHLEKKSFSRSQYPFLPTLV